MATNGSSVQCAGSSLGQHTHICAFFNDLVSPGFWPRSLLRRPG